VRELRADLRQEPIAAPPGPGGDSLGGAQCMLDAVARLSREEKRRLLASVGLFSGLTERELDGLMQVTRTQMLAPREELFHKGDEGTQVYLVITGTLKALTTSDEGDDVVFSILGPGELFGEIAFLGSPVRTATVTAISDSELLAIDRRDFLAFLRSHPDASIKLLSVLATRLKRVSELVEDTLFLNLPVRLAKKLIHYAAAYGEEAGNGSIRIKLKLSQEEWGDLVGATRESINKQMRAWTEEGLIGTDQGFVVLHRPEALEQLAGCVIA
jgi:CRP-like cAMP-binding protein